MIKIKRVYEAPEAGDGFRVLIDRLWPRGLTKDKAKVDLWLKDIAPSTELRKSFGHDPAKWGRFQDRYGRELDRHPELFRRIKDLEREHKIVTLIYGAKDDEHNDAVVLIDRLAALGPVAGVQARRRRGRRDASRRRTKSGIAARVAARR